MQSFLNDIYQVFIKHKLAPLGEFMLQKLDDDFDIKTLSVKYQIDSKHHTGTIRGDFLVVDCEKIEKPAEQFEGSRFQILDKEGLVRGGVRSPIDDKVYYDRKSYEEHAKRHDCVLVGNDFASKRAKRLETRAAKQAAKEKATKGNLVTI